MTAFNAIDRKPISGNKELLKGLLRDKEGFEGTVISDWGSIGQLEEQGVAADMDHAGANETSIVMAVRPDLVPLPKQLYPQTAAGIHRQCQFPAHDCRSIPF